MTDIVFLYVTAPNSETAARIGRTLVEEKLAACVNILPGVQSIYRWEEQVETEAEVLLIIKSTALCVDAMIERIETLHPYEVPEVIAYKSGTDEYLERIQRAKETVSQVVKNAEGIEQPTVGDMFDYTFAVLNPELERQRETLRTSSLGQAPQQETLSGHGVGVS